MSCRRSVPRGRLGSRPRRSPRLPGGGLRLALAVWALLLLGGNLAERTRVWVRAEAPAAEAATPRAETAVPGSLSHAPLSPQVLPDGRRAVPSLSLRLSTVRASSAGLPGARLPAPRLAARSAGPPPPPPSFRAAGLPAGFLADHALSPPAVA